VDWMDLAQDRDKWRVVNTVMKFLMRNKNHAMKTFLGNESIAPCII
jgi:hypothetical protein